MSIEYRLFRTYRREDYHHDKLYPSSISLSVIIERASAIWSRRGIKPKQHLSEQRPGAVTLMERRAHADRCEDLPADLPPGMGKRFMDPSHPFNLTTLKSRLDDRGLFKVRCTGIFTYESNVGEG